MPIRYALKVQITPKLFIIQYAKNFCTFMTIHMWLHWSSLCSLWFKIQFIKSTETSWINYGISSIKWLIMQTFMRLRKFYTYWYKLQVKKIVEKYLPCYKHTSNRHTHIYVSIYIERYRYISISTFHAKMGSIKDRNGMDLTEAEDVKKRWQEYIEELYKKELHSEDNHDGVITHLEPDILECGP